MFNFDRKDNDLCRVYYRNTDRGLYCIQDKGDLGIEFLRCSSEGEPEYPLTMPSENEFDKFVLPSGKVMKTFSVTINAEATDSLQASTIIQATTPKEAVALVNQTIEDEGADVFDFQFHSCGTGLFNIEVEEPAEKIKS